MPRVQALLGVRATVVIKHFHLKIWLKSLDRSLFPLRKLVNRQAFPETILTIHQEKPYFMG